MPKQILTQFRFLDRTFHEARRSLQYEAALLAIDEMISLVQQNSIEFHEPVDSIRVLKCRRSMLLFNKDRLRGGSIALKHLRQAAADSTPSICDYEPCKEIAPDVCVTRWNELSPKQAKMCLEKITHISEALKIEAAISAGKFNYVEALEKRRLATYYHSFVVEMEPTEKRQRNQRYLEYWQYLTEGSLSLLQGDFDSSRNWFDKTWEKAKTLSPKCFPNYFRDTKQIKTHSIFVTAVEKFASSDFGGASTQLEGWLELSPELKGKRDLRFDNVEICAMACKLIEQLRQHEEIPKERWDALDDLLERNYVAMPTWALRYRLNLPRELAFWARHGQSSLWQALDSAVNSLAHEWWVLLPDAELLDQDRAVGVTQRGTFPSFVDVFPYLNETTDNWRQILLQNLKNALLLLADYEYLRYVNPPAEDGTLPRNLHVQEPSEAQDYLGLIDTILLLLARRSKKKAAHFESASQAIKAFGEAIDAGNFEAAIVLQKAYVEKMRIWPHIVRIESQRTLPHPVFWDEERPNLDAKETIALRFRSGASETVTFEGPQVLEPSSYYYLRPRWNGRRHDKYRIRHEHFLKSDLPSSVNVFFENLRGKQWIRREKFLDWILQFDQTERLLACRIFRLLRFYGDDEIRGLWLGLYRSRLPPEAKTERVAYFGLGHTSKSGPYTCQYHCRQAMTQLSANERSFEFKKAFREISEVHQAEERPQAVIFIDDFIGGGTQAVGLLTKYFESYPWLESVPVYFGALIGFEAGIETLRRTMQGRIRNVFVAEVLGEPARAFSDRNPAWSSEQDLMQAKLWTARIGREILKGRPNYDPDRDELGYENTQACVAFHYNVPNNTLPIFWGTGIRRGTTWKPLVDRYD
jgi:hypothetical protein